MPQLQGTVIYTMTNAGAAVTWAVDDFIGQYVLNGSDTLAASYTFAESGTPFAGLTYIVDYNAQMTLNGNNITIFGRQLTQQEALKKFQLVAIYDGSAFQTFILPENSVTGRFYHGVTTTTVPSVGGTVTLNPALSKGFQVYNSGAGTVTLSSNYTITAGGTPQEGDEFFVLWSGTVYPDGNTVTIFGETLTDSQVTNGDVLVHAVYNGSAWVVLQGATNAASTVVSKSYAQLQTMVSAGTLEINRKYFINDRNIWVTAVEVDKFALQGEFKMLCPDYQDASGLFGGVWISGMALPAIGDLYSYNNFMWENLTGAVGTAPTGDAVNWACVGTYGSGTWKDWVNKTGSDYVTEIYYCEYDFTNDWVQLLEDKQRGNKGGMSWQQEQSVSLGFNAIDKFQWGRNVHFSNLFIEAYINNVNTTTGVYTANSLLPAEQLVLGETESSNLVPIATVSKFCPAYCKKLTITTAQVLALNGTPQTIIAAPGSGKAIEIISASVKMTYNSIAYATNTNLQLWNATSGFVVATAASALAATNNTFFKMSTEFVSLTQMQANTAIRVAVETGNPTAGNSDITVYVYYHIIDL